MQYAERTAVLRVPSLKPALCAALFASGGLLLTTPASADGPSVALNTGAVVLHYAQDGTTAVAHPNGSQPSWISHSDCAQNIIVRVPLTMSGLPTSDVLQVWASSGADCTQGVNRSGTTQQCWQVVSGGIAPAQAVTVDIRAQDIVAPITLGTGQKPTTFTPGTPAACDSVTQSGPIALTIYFMFINGAGGSANADGTSATYALSAALIGPAAPTGVGVGVGDGLLKVSWTPTNSSNTQGFQIFCDPPPGKEGTTSDAGTGDTIVDSGSVLVCDDGGSEDGGFDDAGNYLGDIPLDGGCSYQNQSTGTTGTSGNCASSEIFSGGGTTSSTTTTGDDESGTGTDTVATGVTPPPANIGDYICGPNGSNVGSPTSASTTITGLKNGTHYVVGVAAYDVVGNIGPMSIPGCDSPTPVSDFWNVYKNAGGSGGGGFCSVDKNNEPAGLGAFAIVGAACAVSVFRRRRQSKRSPRR